MSLRVLLDATYAHRAPHSGTAVYIDRLTQALSELPGVEVVAAVNGYRRPPAGGGAGSVRNAVDDLRWTQLELPRQARAARADVIHHPLPARAYGAAPAQVVTVHDLAFERLPQQFAPAYRRYAHVAHRAAARQARAVICVSQATAQDVRTRWGVAAERIIVARHGAGQALTPLPRRQPPEHFLYVGDDQPRKNLPALLTAYDRYAGAAEHPLPLVLAGTATAHAPGVTVVPHPGADRLSELYAAAVALVHPSLHEGFGLTVLEAMGLGTPVITTRSDAAVEMCGDVARYVDPSTPQAMADEMADEMAVLATDTELSADLGERGRARAALFSWQLSARAHLEAYSLAAR